MVGQGEPRDEAQVRLGEADHRHDDEEGGQNDRADGLEAVDEVIAVDPQQKLDDAQDGEGRQKRQAGQARDGQRADNAVDGVPAARAGPVEQGRQVDATRPKAMAGKGQLGHADRRPHARGQRQERAADQVADDDGGHAVGKTQTKTHGQSPNQPHRQAHIRRQPQTKEGADGAVALVRRDPLDAMRLDDQHLLSIAFGLIGPVTRRHCPIHRPSPFPAVGSPITTGGRSL